MKRRGFLATSFAAIAAPRAASGQQSSRVYRVAILTVAETPAELSQATKRRDWRAWQDELRQLGYTEGRNLLIARRTAEGDARRLPDLAREIVGLEPDAIFAATNRAVSAFTAAKTTIPIVAIVADPVGFGFAASLARPGGNVTGFSIDTGSELVQKHMELLREVVPAATRMAFLAPRSVWDGGYGAVMRGAGQAAGITVVAALLEPPVEDAKYRGVFATMMRNRVDALYVMTGPENTLHHRLIAGLAAEAKLPAIYFRREFADAGGLMTYAVDFVDMNRRAAGYIDRILKGSNPAEMPFQQPAKFELIINLKTAKDLGLTVPETILARADEIIE
jgi:putative ABC transport system substrate-binding protein